MLADVTQTIEKAYAGPFSTGQLAVAGIVLVVAIAALMWWENRAARSWVMLPLFLLRLVAMAVVLWMLAGPVTRTITVHTRPKAIGVLVDTSGSMSVVDPLEDDHDAVRWAAVYEASGPAGLLVEMDGAAVALAAARGYFRQFADVCRGGGQAALGRKAVAHALASAEAATQHVENVLERLQEDHGIGNDELGEVHAGLTAALLPRLNSLVDDMQSDRLLLASDRAERLEETAALLEPLVRQTARLADGLAAWYAGRQDEATAARTRAQSTRSRLEKVSALLDATQQPWLKALEQEARVLRYRFDGAVFPVAEADWGRALTAPTAPTGSAAATDLSGALDQASRDSAVEPLEAIILLTDGRHNAGGDPLKKASAMAGLPAYIVPVGITNPLRDVMLHHVQAPRAVLKNDLIVIEAMVDAHGCAGEEVVVDLLAEDKVVDSETIAITSESFVRPVTFTYKAEKMGMQALRLKAHELPKENVPDNNEAEVKVEVTEDKIKVLLVDQLPRWEYRYLRNLFKRAEVVDYDELLFEPAQADQPRPHFPKDLDAWGQYRVVILGDVRPADLSGPQQDLLEEFVDKRGGTLVLIAGRDAMPGAYIGQTLEKLLPVQPVVEPAPDTEKGYSLLVTAEGRSEPMTQLADDPEASDRFWREQFSARFPIYDLSLYSQPRPTSHVLIRAVPVAGAEPTGDVERSLLCWHKYGRGRVVYLSAPVMYRLRYRHGDRPHQLFWEQLLRWAVAREVAGGSQTVRLATDKVRYAKGDPIRVTVRLNRLDGSEVRGAKCRVTARQDEKVIANEALEEDADVPGTYTAFLKDLPEGAIAIGVVGEEIGTLLASEAYVDPVETAVVVDPPDLMEMRNTRCNLPLLKQIAESTGGLVVPPTALAAAVDQLDLAPEVTQEIHQTPLWTRWACLLAFLGCLTAEWVVRKLTGLA